MNRRTLKFLEPLGEAEKRVVEASQRGDTAICGPTLDDGSSCNDPSNSGGWGAQRIIRADVIHYLCADREGAPKIDKSGIHIYAARIRGVLDLSYSKIAFPLSFERCFFEDVLSLRNSTVPYLKFSGSRTKSIFADGIVISTYLLLNAGFHSTGDVLLRDAKVGGNFQADGSIFECHDGIALGCDRMRVNGGLFLSTRNRPSRLRGETRLSGAWIGNNLECDMASLQNPGGNALVAERLTTLGSVYLRDGFSSKGGVNLSHAKIGAALDCTSGHFENSGKEALRAEVANIGSLAHLHLAEFDGNVSLMGVHAGGISCRSSKLTKLDLRHARIAGPLRWTGIADPNNTVLDLRNASVETIEDEPASWPAAGSIFLDGLNYDGFTESVVDVKARLRWIGLDAENAPQPYRQLSNVYTKMGESKPAHEVMYTLEKILHARQLHSTHGKIRKFLFLCWAILLKWTIGYGYKLSRAVSLMALITAVGFVCSFAGYRSGVIVPTDRDAYAWFASHNGVSPLYYPRFSASMYSIEHSVPAINLGISNNWSANTPRSASQPSRYARTLRWWFWIQTLFGWGLSFFFVTGITGLAKTDK